MQSDQTLQGIWQREPMHFKDAFWPQVKFHSKQVDEILSVRDNVETYVHAGNMLGKDFVAAFIVWWFFVCFYKPLDRVKEEAIKYGITPETPVRIVTTSVKSEHLDVLWAEIGKFGATSQIPLLKGYGGPFVMTHHEIRHGSEIELGSNTVSYVKGMVSDMNHKESLQGHHAKHNLAIVDEASGVPDWAYEMLQGWMKKGLFFGNPNLCANWWYRGCKAGDLMA